MEDIDIDDGTMAECQQACADCARICHEHVRHCLTLGGEHAAPDHIAMLLTCAQVCATAGTLMALESDWHTTFCDLCAQVCDECAEACEDMDDMEECADACRECADACREMLQGSESDDEEEAGEDVETVN